jgi:hypothetical protein
MCADQNFTPRHNFYAKALNRLRLLHLEISFGDIRIKIDCEIWNEWAK